MPAFLNGPEVLSHLRRRWRHESPSPPYTAATEGVVPYQALKFNRRWVLLLVLIEAVLCTLIVRFTSYTEIDWGAYMKQVEQFQHGERDYYKIQGSTGPLVYPAGFVYVFSILRSLTARRHEVGKASVATL